MYSVISVLLLFFGAEAVLNVSGDYQSVPARPDIRSGLWVIESVTETVLTSDDASGASRYVTRTRRQFCRGAWSPPAIGWLRSPDGRTFLRARASAVPNSNANSTTEVFSGDFNRQYTYMSTSVRTESAKAPATPVSSTTYDKHTWAGECPSDMAIDETRDLPQDLNSE